MSDNISKENRFLLSELKTQFSDFRVQFLEMRKDITNTMIQTGKIDESIGAIKENLIAINNMLDKQEQSNKQTYATKEELETTKNEQKSLRRTMNWLIGALTSVIIGEIVTISAFILSLINK